MISITDTAATELHRLLEKKGNPELALRVFVSPGGCSGFSYGMTFEDSPADDDQVIDQDGIRIVVDDVSRMHLDGAEVDYIDSLMGGGFAIYNPNAVSTCSCGHSFRTAAEEGTPRTCH